MTPAPLTGPMLDVVADAGPTPLPRRRLELALRRALVAVLGEPYGDRDPMMRRARDAERFDYQADVALALAREVGEPPRDLAERLALALADEPWLADVQVAGPGFINLRLNDAALGKAAAAVLADKRLGIPVADPPLRTVIDYSSPNVAKEMHVGHLRSTVIGDALARTLAFAGHDVVRQNHLGDWGTQFGMLVEHMSDSDEERVSDFARLGELYRAAKRRYDNDEDFAVRARERVVALQRGDEHTRAVWQGLVDVSRRHMAELYARLGVTLVDADVKGESFYNAALDDTVGALLDAGVAREDEGALVIFSEAHTNRDGEAAALLVRKSDGGHLYGTTDLAALRHRVGELAGRRLIYVTDARQAQHFELVFEAARRAGWLETSTSAEHVPFGTVLAENGRPFKTREGETVSLERLLDEAVARARVIIDAKSPELSPSTRADVAEAVGIGAVKYADLATGRQRDYTFSFERMLALDGNTAPYLLYAHVRATAIARRAGESAAPDEAHQPLLVTDAAERALVLKALEFADGVEDVVIRLEPHRLCTYLYELADAYTTFYERCPVLNAPGAEQRRSRLALCALAARTLGQGLTLLGIRTVEVM